MTREQLLVDKDKLQKELQLMRVNAIRIEGALAYIESNLEVKDDRPQPDTEK